MSNQPPLNPDAFDLACKELFLTITAHKSAADVLGFDWKSLKASTRKPWETATRKVLTAYIEADGTEDELHEINTRLARILTDTANALKGEPEPLTSHSWHDLAEVAKRAVDGLKEQTDVQSVDNHLAVAQPEVNSVEELVTTRVGLALANAAFKEGLSAGIRACNESLEGEPFVKPVSPYSAPLLAMIKADRPEVKP